MPQKSRLPLANSSLPALLPVPALICPNQWELCLWLKVVGCLGVVPPFCLCTKCLPSCYLPQIFLASKMKSWPLSSHGETNKQNATEIHLDVKPLQVLGGREGNTPSCSVCHFLKSIVSTTFKRGHESVWEMYSVWWKGGRAGGGRMHNLGYAAIAWANICRGEFSPLLSAFLPLSSLPSLS